MPMHVQLALPCSTSQQDLAKLRPWCSLMHQTIDMAKGKDLQQKLCVKDAVEIQHEKTADVMLRLSWQM